MSRGVRMEMTLMGMMMREFDDCDDLDDETKNMETYRQLEKDSASKTPDTK
jgi:hypothetical protein